MKNFRFAKLNPEGGTNLSRHKILCALAAALTALTCFGTSKPANANTISDYFYQGNPASSESVSCSGLQCDSVSLIPTGFDPMGFVEFDFDTRGVSGTFTSGGSLFAIFGLFGPDTVMSGLVTLTTGKITAWSLSGFGTGGRANWSISTSNGGDSDILRYSPILAADVIDAASSPTGVWSGPSVSIDGVLQSNTPLPTTLPLFATGLGGLGLLGWRRKKAAVVPAA